MTQPSGACTYCKHLHKHSVHAPVVTIWQNPVLRFIAISRSIHLARRAEGISLLITYADRADLMEPIAEVRHQKRRHCYTRCPRKSLAHSSSSASVLPHSAATAACCPSLRVVAT